MAQREVALDVLVNTFLSASLAESTKKTYISQLKTFLSFCQSYGYTAVPAKTSTILRYIAHLSLSLSFKSIQQYINIVKAINDEKKFPTTQVNMVLKGIRRIKGDCSVQKLPMTLDILLCISEHLNLSTSLGATFWSACLVAFYGMLRKSSLFPPKGQLSPKLSDVLVKPNGLVIHFGYSKTVQCKQRRPFIVLSRSFSADNRLCPVKALCNAWKLSGVRRCEEPLLPVQENNRVTSMSANQFTTMLNSVLNVLNLKGYSGHSFRRGGASHALSCGVPMEMIMAQGDWKSLAYVEYLNLKDIESREKHLRKMLLVV